MGSDSELDEFRRGYVAGWLSAGHPEPGQLPKWIPDNALLPNKSAYEAGFEIGQALAVGN